MGKEKSMLTPTIDLFSPMYTKNNLQEKVVESQNGAVVLDGGVAAIAITVFGKTVFVLLCVCGRGYFGSWKGLFCVVIGKVCLREQFLINLICRDSASILRVELLA